MRFVATATLFALGLASCQAVNAQQEGAIPTQTIVTVESKSKGPVEPSSVTAYINDRKEPLAAWSPVTASNTQVALLIDSSLRQSVGREMESFRNFVRGLPEGTEVLVGYMQFGRVVYDHGFTTDHARAADDVRLPEGMPGMTASPYFCLSDFVKKWPKSAYDSSESNLSSTSTHKARFVMMITNGVDLYNGAPTVMNQDSPYVQAAISDAQKAGVSVYAIYYGEAGIGGGGANFSGQSYLQDLTHSTGGVNYWQGMGNPVSTAPYLDQFQKAIAESYVATVNAAARSQDHMVRVRFTAAGKKLRAPELVLPGNQE